MVRRHREREPRLRADPLAAAARGIDASAAVVVREGQAHVERDGDARPLALVADHVVLQIRGPKYEEPRLREKPYVLD